jgi:hypothetical protein
VTLVDVAYSALSCMYGLRGPAEAQSLPWSSICSLEVESMAIAMETAICRDNSEQIISEVQKW